MESKERKEIRYYWCVNCGHHGDFGKVRKTKLVCENCEYDDLTDYTEEEILEHEDLCLNRFKRKGTY